MTISPAYDARTLSEMDQKPPTSSAGVKHLLRHALTEADRAVADSLQVFRTGIDPSEDSVSIESEVRHLKGVADSIRNELSEFEEMWRSQSIGEAVLEPEGKNPQHRSDGTINTHITRSTADISHHGIPLSVNVVLYNAEEDDQLEHSMLCSSEVEQFIETETARDTLQSGGLSADELMPTCAAPKCATPGGEKVTFVESPASTPRQQAKNDRPLKSFDRDLVSKYKAIWVSCPRREGVHVRSTAPRRGRSRSKKYRPSLISSSKRRGFASLPKHYASRTSVPIRQQVPKENVVFYPLHRTKGKYGIAIVGSAQEIGWLVLMCDLLDRSAR